MRSRRAEKQTLAGERQGWNTDAANVVRNGRSRGFVMRRNASGAVKTGTTAARKWTKIVYDDGPTTTSLGAILKEALANDPSA